MQILIHDLLAQLAFGLAHEEGQEPPIFRVALGVGKAGAAIAAQDEHGHSLSRRLIEQLIGVSLIGASVQVRLR